MTLELKVTRLDHEDLVNILSTAFYGSSDMSLDYKKEDYLAVPEHKRTIANEEKGEFVCFEDKCADILLNGGSVYITDWLAEGEVFGNLPHHFIDEDPSESPVVYKVNLNDIIRGMENRQASNYVREFDECNEDYYTGYNLIQIIVFGEEIYG